MTKEELAKQLFLLPNDATIYTEADHGQHPEKAFGFAVAIVEGELPQYGDSIEWRDVESLTPTELSKVNAILIQA